MEILGFLLGLGCLILVAWAISILGGLVFGRKRRHQNRPQEPPSLTHPEIQERNSSQPTITAPPPPSAPPRRVVTLRQPPVSTRVRLPSSRHQQYIRLAERVLKRLRSGEVQLPKALAILRKMNPYAFEELLLTCCHEQGWRIERNFRYTGDGGLDGRVTIAGRLYLIQAKRYRGYINPKHIRDFDQVIQGEEACGGFFIHTGRTGELSKELLREYQISLISGQRLVDFVLGQRFKILG
ncbi:restriction endonuclease [Chlorogloea sp. CCALA 695]|uniref:restriction endonuclease n=1 Tax=Chlorogloea sp. CCALA 695 TaxID=2107693 RepID=UPI000D060CCE|nr:restriction endonuclease [Chlorogloea sp. CCALA 695]PSB30611.1 restriction endonuclease [Chlorogloea sp. CCALA 695]